jgi:hypothetical protein
MTAHGKAQTKTDIVSKMLARGKGATIDEITKATGWQPHSCRAFLTGLRKKSRIVREQRSDGKLTYRSEAAPSAEPEGSVAETAE